MDAFPFFLSSKLSVWALLLVWKTGGRSLMRQPSLFLQEVHLVHHLKYHPPVRFSQHAERREACAYALVVSSEPCCLLKRDERRKKAGDTHPPRLKVHNAPLNHWQDIGNRERTVQFPCQ
jgi:hypothetical protein